MAKRRINKRQSARIEKTQADFRQPGADAASGEEGLVISRFRLHAEIETPQKKRIHCSIRPNLDSLVAGDRVIWQSEGASQGVVVSRYPRKSVLGRTGKRGESKPVAANISQLVIVVAAKPLLSWALLDSYLVMAENLHLQALIILNKIDLDCASIKEELLTCYKALGYSIQFCSKENSQQLAQALNNQVSVFVGQSGVGKSSLINAILPHETSIQTADISLLSESGCHTTSNSTLYHLPTGGALIDSPGVREFGLWRMPRNDIIYGFPEFRVLVPYCRFRNCNHSDNQGCALIKSLAAGLTSQKRYDSMMKMIAGLLPRDH